MRELKFRAWVDIEKSIVDNIYPTGGYSFLFRDLNITDKLQFHEFNGNIMQYAELKDKEGTEVYSGDILRSTEGWFLRIVDGEFGGLFAEHAKQPFEFKQGIGEPVNDPQTASYIMQDCEVIGNIYEDKELLDEQTD